MQRIRRIAALALGTVLVTSAVASADPVPDQSYRLAAPGTLSVGTTLPEPTEFAIPTAGTGFTGTWDDVTGDFSGDMSIGPQQTEQGGFTVNISMSTSGVTGTLDPVTGAVDLATAVTVSLEIVTVTTCTIGPINLALSSSNPGGSPFDPADPPDTWAFTVTDAGFAVPGATCELAAIEPIVNGQIGIPTSDTSVVMSFESGLPAPPEVLPAPPAVDEETEVAGEVEEAADPAAPAPSDELPFTGAETPYLAAAGLLLVAAGLWFVRAHAALRRLNP